MIEAKDKCRYCGQPLTYFEEGEGQIKEMDNDGQLVFENTEDDSDRYSRGIYHCYTFGCIYGVRYHPTPSCPPTLRCETCKKRFVCSKASIPNGFCHEWEWLRRPEDGPINWKEIDEKRKQEHT